MARRPIGIMKKINKVILLFLVVTLISSCVTQKSKDDTSFMKQLYHNTTAEYNGYFNADVIMTESIAQLKQQHQDNYNKLLPIYEYVAVEDAKSVSSELDRAIEKVSIVVSLHRQSDWTDDCYLLISKAQYLKKDYESAEETLEYMMEEFNPEAMARNKAKAIKKSKKGPTRKQKVKENKKENKDKVKEREKERDEKEKSAKQRKKEREKERKEYNKAVKKAKSKGKKAPPKPKTKIAEKPTTTPNNAVDAARKANELAEAAKEKDKKKQEDKPKDKSEEGGLFKKDPAFQEAKLWLARTYIEREKYDLADGILAKLDQDAATYDEIRAELGHVRAYYHLAQKDYSRAIPYLEKAIDLGKKREDKARYAYILAQLHQKENNTDEAFAYFSKAMKYSTNYELEFSARLSMAQNSYQTGKSTPEQTTRALTKLLKDSKNEEYKDQIYYALANVALDNKQRPEAIDYLKSSLACNTRNKAQRSESYLKLANLHFEEENYVDSKYYFDSTLQVLATTDERYDEVARYRESLTGIAANIEIITLQDSLLAISAMTDREKRKLAAKLKEDIAKKASASQAQANANRSSKNQPPAVQSISLSNRTGTRGGIANDTGTSFPLYDEKILKKGKKDFEKRWGDRPLEDNWRRSSEQRTSDDVASEEKEEEEISGLDDKEIAFLLQGVPTTDEEKADAEKKISDAMMDLGKLYRERLEKNDKTVDVLEDELLKRFPETTHELDAWYYLYLAHTDLNNKAKAQTYFDKIVNNYPETTYARILKDPSFLANSQAERKQLQDYYNATFVDYQSGKFKSAYERIQTATEKFGAGNALQAKFALLAALCTGNIQGKEAYLKSLKEVIAKYPNTDEQKRAKEIVRLLNGGEVASAGGAAAAVLNNAEAAKKFKIEDEKLHYMLIMITDLGGKRINDAKTLLASYNREFYSLEKLRVSNIYLGTDTSRPIMVIRKFKNKERAMEYYNAGEKAGASFLPEGISYEMYPVTQNNYRQILKDKSLAGYNEFFTANYLN